MRPAPVREETASDVLTDGYNQNGNEHVKRYFCQFGFNRSAKKPGLVPGSTNPIYRPYFPTIFIAWFQVSFGNEKSSGGLYCRTSHSRSVDPSIVLMST